MEKDAWVLFFAEAVRRSQRESQAERQAAWSDRDLVTRAHSAALEHGEPEARAWSAAVGAYLQRYPSVGLFKAERMVACLIRPDILPDVSGEPPPPR
jgi:hypothetical protein